MRNTAATPKQRTTVPSRFSWSLSRIARLLCSPGLAVATAAVTGSLHATYDRCAESLSGVLQSNMNSNEIREQRNGLVMLAIVSLIVGAASGLLGTLFRFSLERADQLRDVLVTWARSEHAIGLVIVLLAASASTALAAWLVGRFAPEASGSGIPQVEAILNGDLPPARLSLIPVKFIGGVLAIGAGLALGREGPSVHMGAAIAHVLGKSFRRNSHDCMVLMAAGAGAGLATAFDAPIAGAVFVLEELTRRFDTRTAVATLGASASAIAVARLMHGGGAEFQLAVQPLLGFGTLPAHLLLGVIAGLLGVAVPAPVVAAGSRGRILPPHVSVMRVRKRSLIFKECCAASDSCGDANR
jgi:chloride channel protein, CIC family